MEANPVNYLWPLGIVFLAPLLPAGVRLTHLHMVAVLGFCRRGHRHHGRGGAGASRIHRGRRGLYAAQAAVVWSTYSLLTKRLSMTGRAFPTAAIGLFGGCRALALVCRRWSPKALSARDLALDRPVGLGPLGGAFFLWDAALKRGDAGRSACWSYLTPSCQRHHPDGRRGPPLLDSTRATTCSTSVALARQVIYQFLSARA